MPDKYSTGSKKANIEIETAVNHAVSQVQAAASLTDQDRIEYAYLIVREKLDRMEEDKAYRRLSMGVSDSEVCEAVMNELGDRLGIAVISLDKEYPEALPELQQHGLVLA